MSQQRGFGGTSSRIGLLWLACAVAMAAPASPAAARLGAAPIDVATDFRALAQQRPWTCTEQQTTGLPRTGWAGGEAACAWQNRLRMRSWRGQGAAAPGACVSAVAQWWAWARSAAPATLAAPAAWRTVWTAQSLVDNSGQEQRIVTLRRLPDGEWTVTEWRWNPSPRAATRRWQEGRWALLAARAEQLRAPVPAPEGPAQARMLQRVLESNLGARGGETGGPSWRWQADGVCLSVEAAGLGQQLMQLPYAADDSRLEQRAAMQVQLARRYPKATWLTDFAMLPATPHARGGAKFHAVWLEQSILKGQLWIPTKGEGPLVRVRITTALPVLPAGQPDPKSVARAAQVVQRELMGLAARWTLEHE